MQVERLLLEARASKLWPGMSSMLLDGEDGPS
jgi:hypothetical protein